MGDKQNYFTYTDNTSDSNDKTMESLHKQIIIDGVDVNALYSDRIACMNRYEVARLFIKTVEQLKAKEQELEQYKRSKQASYEAIQTKCNELELENRELRAVHSTNVALSDELFKYKAENKRLKQTLDEIKEIAGQINITIMGGIDSPKKEWICLYANAMGAILQKISEVDDESYFDNH